MSTSQNTSTFTGESNSGTVVGQNHGTINYSQVPSAAEKRAEIERTCQQLLRSAEGQTSEGYEWYKNRIDTRLEGTCEWFLQHDSYVAWRNAPSGAILVSADPGCGKSVLAKYLVDQQLDGIICYFFFKESDQSNQKQALRAIIHQLFEQVPALRVHAVPQYENNGSNFANITHSLWTILVQAVQDPRAGSVSFVIDALDECDSEDVQSFISTLKRQFVGKENSHAKWLLTSRPYQYVMNEFSEDLQDHAIIHIPGDEHSEQIAKEVNCVIKHRTERLSRKFKLNDTLKGVILDRLLTMHHRTYLWAYLVFDHLEQGFTKGFTRTSRGIKDLIDTTPRNVSEAYESILRKSTNEKSARIILSLILAAARPLSLQEINIAHCIGSLPGSPSIDELDLEDDEYFTSTVRNCCGLLISIHGTKVYFLHQTVREFLTAENTKTASPSTQEFSWSHSISLVAANRLVTETCLRYIDKFESEAGIDRDCNWLNEFKEYGGGCPRSSWKMTGEAYRGTGEDYSFHAFNCKLEELYRQYRFLKYSSGYWSEHFKLSQPEDDFELVEMAAAACTSGAASVFTWFAPFWCRFNFIAGFPYEPPRDVSPLMVASVMDLVLPLKLLLGSHDPNTYDGTGKTALLYASRAGRDQIARVLIENLADVNYASNGHTALHMALRHDKLSTAQLLIDSGADCTVEGVLHASFGRESRGLDCVKLLLERRVDVNQVTGEGSPLHRAIRYSNQECVKLLLEHGADANQLNDRRGKTVLYRAVRDGNQECVKLLLEHGADANQLNDRRGETVLHTAAEFGKYKCVKVLLEHGADVNYPSILNGTALHTAAQFGEYECVKLLLEHGADVNHPNNLKVTALHKAARNGKYECVKLLLEHGADVNQPSSWGGTALHRAAGYGNHECVKLLLEHGANVNQSDNLKETALHVAVKYSNHECVKLLLEHGADANAKDGSGRTPKQWALEYKQERLQKKEDYEHCLNLLSEHAAKKDMSVLY